MLHLMATLAKQLSLATISPKPMRKQTVSPSITSYLPLSWSSETWMLKWANMKINSANMKINSSQTNDEHLAGFSSFKNRLA